MGVSYPFGLIKLLLVTINQMNRLNITEAVNNKPNE
jgi:hypothetical protein